MHLVILALYLRRKILAATNTQLHMLKFSSQNLESLDSVKGTKYNLPQWEVVVAVYSACEAGR